MTFIPIMRYEDAPRAIEWLCEAFGFEKHLVVPGEDGTILHAQLKSGEAMIMMGSERSDDMRMVSPAKAGGNTRSVYVVIDDSDVKDHFARAKAAGAEIVHEIIEPPHGGQLYSCLDLEGHLWNFGSYDPWQEV